MGYRFRMRTLLLAATLITVLLSGNLAIYRVLGVFSLDSQTDAVMIGHLLAPLPLYLVWCLSLVSIIEHRRSFESSRFLIISLTICILWEFCFDPASYVLQGYLVKSASVARWWAVIRLILDSLITALCWLLLLIAIFRATGRQRSGAPAIHDGH
jgi:hypothetical protein